MVGVFPPSVRVLLPLEGWPEQDESVSVVCQGCRWHGIAVRGTTGTPSTVLLALYGPLCTEPPNYFTAEREREIRRMGEGVSQ